MAFRSFRLNVTVRCIALAASLFLLFYLLTQTALYATSTVVALVVIYQVYALIHYAEKTNQELLRFLLSIRYADFTQTFSAKGRGRSFDELSTAFSEVVNQFQKIRADKEEHSLYLQTVVQHIGVGLIAFTPDGAVTLINNASKRILGVNQLIDVRSLKRLSEELVTVLLEVRPGEKSLVKLEVHGEFLQLVMYATEIRLHGQSQKLVSIQNIQSELDEKEMEAWQKLVRVLTHEIMNSLTPISSLASTVNGMLRPETQNGLTQKELTVDAMRDVRGAVETIEKRSQGLLHFVDAYRNLARIPRPNFGIVPVADLFRRVEQLMQERFSSAQISFSKHVDPTSLELTADAELIEQVLINLVRNAMDAVMDRNDSSIALAGRIGENGRVIIEVTDNGIGIPKDVQDRIFVPFFTTKPNGSGIGLSLSRQIMRLHRGSISVNSEPGRQTAFTLRF
jgi:nitrogen fixation/metabolism regulation signal transduction histidine kinase